MLLRNSYFQLWSVSCTRLRKIILPYTINCFLIFCCNSVWGTLIKPLFYYSRVKRQSTALTALYIYYIREFIFPVLVRFISNIVCLKPWLSIEYGSSKTCSLKSLEDSKAASLPRNMFILLDESLGKCEQERSWVFVWIRRCTFPI
jgi:hypothetical protein